MTYYKTVYKVQQTGRIFSSVAEYEQYREDENVTGREVLELLYIADSAPIEAAEE